MSNTKPVRGYLNQTKQFKQQVSGCMPCKINSFLTDDEILMKLYTVTVYGLRMCKINHSSNCLKGDNQ